MKQFLALLFVLLIGSAFAADQTFLADFDDCYRSIRLNHGYSEDNTDFATDSVLSWYLRQSVVEVACFVMGYEFDTSVITSQDVAKYGFGASSDIWGISSVIWSKGDSTKALKYIPAQLWPDMEHQTCVGKQQYEARPSYYDWSDDYLRVYPAPNEDAETLIVNAYGLAEDVDTTSDMDSVRVYYRMAIVNHATWKLAIARSDPRADAFRLMYEESRNMAAAMRDRRIRSSVPAVADNK